MLKLLGNVFYILIAVVLLGMFLSFGDYKDNVFTAIVGISSALSLALFGAMCFAADEAIALLQRLAGERTGALASPGDAEASAGPSHGTGQREGVEPTESELMERYSIVKEGDHYRYEDYKYDRLTDAVAYARKWGPV